MKKKKKLRIKWKNLFLLLFYLGITITFIISIIFVINWLFDSKETKEDTKKVKDKVVIKEVTNTNKVEIVKPKEEIKKEDPYWDYIKFNLIDVDFTKLKEQNNETTGWIKVKGTNINYPFVQAKDNKFYLKHSFDKSYNEAGWVFMDYRNNKDNFDKNTILYAHGRVDKTMFGSLKNIFTNNWLNNKNNYVINLSTEKENTLWQVFSVYKIPTTKDYIQTKFADDEEFLKFGKMLLDRSQHNFNTSIDSNAKILTLSTCYNDEKKVVLHAKLIKIEKK